MEQIIATILFLGVVIWYYKKPLHKQEKKSDIDALKMRDRVYERLNEQKGEKNV